MEQVPLGFQQYQPNYVFIFWSLHFLRRTIKKLKGKTSLRPHFYLNVTWRTFYLEVNNFYIPHYVIFILKLLKRLCARTLHLNIRYQLTHKHVWWMKNWWVTQPINQLWGFFLVINHLCLFPYVDVMKVKSNPIVVWRQWIAERHVWENGKNRVLFNCILCV